MSRRPTKHEHAIVVGATDYGDSDRIVRLITPSLGRISALARRARSSTKQFGGSLDTGNHIEAGLRQGRGDLWTLQSALLQHGRPNARKNLQTLTTLAYACEVCGSLARTAHPEPQLFGLLDMATSVLDATTAPPRDLFRIGLEAKALTFAGLAPVLDRCARCSDPVQGPMVMEPGAGGAVHQACASGPSTPVSVSWLSDAERARRTPLRGLVDQGGSPEETWLLSQAIEFHLSKPLKSRAVLATLEHQR